MSNLIILLLIVSILGIHLTVVEWKTIISKGYTRGFLRLLVINLPLILALNLTLRGGL